MKNMLKSFVLVSALALTCSVAASQLGNQMAAKARDYEARVKTLNDAITRLQAIDNAGAMATDATAGALVGTVMGEWQTIQDILKDLTNFKSQVQKSNKMPEIKARQTFADALRVKDVETWLTNKAQERKRAVETTFHFGPNQTYKDVLEYYSQALPAATRAQTAEVQLAWQSFWEERQKYFEADLKACEEKWEQAVKEKMSLEIDIKNYKDTLIAVDQYLKNRAAYTDVAARQEAIDTIQLLYGANPPLLP